MKSSLTHKIQHTKDTICDTVNKWKNQGEKIVFTNGCFDILHKGHVVYLEGAKSLGTKLIVAINDDNSVKRLKGPSRPINNLTNRMYVIAALESVDLVCSFEEDTPLDLIKSIGPNFLVKGGDYLIDNIVGADYVKSINGQVVTIPFVDGESTSTIISKIIQH